MSNGVVTGTVKWFNESKGFGFIKPDDGGEDVFAHFSEIQGAGFRNLAENQRVQFELTSRDVIHSFWIPAFLYKLDVIPGVRNVFQVVPGRTGTFRGKCAELCGEYHSEMLFNVKVVSEAEYEAYLATLNNGQLGAEYDRNTNLNPTK